MLFIQYPVHSLNTDFHQEYCNWHNNIIIYQQYCRNIQQQIWKLPGQISPPWHSSHLEILLMLWAFPKVCNVTILKLSVQLAKVLTFFLIFYLLYLKYINSNAAMPKTRSFSGTPRPLSINTENLERQDDAHAKWPKCADYFGRKSTTFCFWWDYNV